MTKFNQIYENCINKMLIENTFNYDMPGKSSIDDEEKEFEKIDQFLLNNDFKKDKDGNFENKKIGMDVRFEQNDKYDSESTDQPYYIYAISDSTKYNETSNENTKTHDPYGFTVNNFKHDFNQVLKSINKR